MTGFLTRAALALEPYSSSPVWPASAPAAATRLLPLLSENVRDATVTKPAPRQRPRAGFASSVPLGVRVNGPMALAGVYDGLTDVWALALGLQPAQLPELLTTGVYRHVYEVDPRLHSHAWPFGSGQQFGSSFEFGQQLVRRATLAVDRGVSTWEHLSTMVQSLTLNATPNGVSLLLNLLGHSTDRASATHPNLDALVEPDWPAIDFTDLTIRIGGLSDTVPLSPLTEGTPSAFQLNLSNHLTSRQRRDTGLYIGEPRRKLIPTVSGSIELGYYEHDAISDRVNDQATLMGQFQFTGPEIGSTGYFYQLTFYIPAMQLSAVSVGTQGPSDRGLRFNWRAVVSDTVASGFPVSVGRVPLTVEVVSTESANPLI